MMTTAHQSSYPNNQSFAMQKYLLLQEQHAELSSHLDQIRPRQASLSSESSSGSSPDISPSRLSPLTPSDASSQSSLQPERRRTRARCSGWGNQKRNSIILDTIPDEETMSAISAEEQRLFTVNESIKRALTELLNCDVVRNDQSVRMWAQARLMEAEKELRSGRRRRGSPCR